MADAAIKNLFRKKWSTKFEKKRIQERIFFRVIPATLTVMLHVHIIKRPYDTRLKFNSIK